MTTPSLRRSGGRTQLEIAPDQLVWALYGRESFDRDGAAEQVTSQLGDMRPFALSIGGRIGQEFPENNVSAFKRVRVLLPDGTYGYRVVRPDWDAMMTALRRGEFNALCLPNIDRGMRDPRDLEDLIDLVEHYGVYVVGMTGNIDLTTDDGIGSARHEVSQRNQESRNISRRIQLGGRRAALKGRNHGGANRPFGWRKDRIRLNQREVKHIRREVPRLVAGVRPITIAREWNERGIPTVSGTVQWRGKTIAQIFTNPRLCGWTIYHGDILRDADGNPIRGQWEPILTVDEHNALVEAIRPQNKPRRNTGRGYVTRYLLSPFARCGKCSGRMFGNSWTDNRTGTTVFVYRCPGKGAGGCGGTSRKGAAVDEYVTALVLMEQGKINLRKQDELPPWDKESELKAVVKQISETTAAFRNRRLSGPRYFPLIEDLEADERKLRAEKRKYDARREARSVSVQNIEAEWNKPGFTLEQKQAAIAKSITAVIIHPAPSHGARFSPDQISIVWKQEDEDE